MNSHLVRFGVRTHANLISQPPCVTLAVLKFETNNHSTININNNNNNKSLQNNNNNNNSPLHRFRGGGRSRWFQEEWGFGNEGIEEKDTKHREEGQTERRDRQRERGRETAGG